MRRTWIKLYVDQCLRGSMIEELTAEQRWLWIGFLLLAGDSSVPGIIFRRKSADGIPIGYSNVTLAEMLDVDIEIYTDGIRRMIDKAKISIDKKGVIHILNWAKYQSEYQRQKVYRGGDKKDCNLSDDVDIERDVDVDVDLRVKAENTGQLFEEFWTNYPREGRFHKKACASRFAAIVKAGGLADLKAGFTGYLDHLKDEELNKNFKKRPMHVMTFLNKERYATYKEFIYEPRL